MSPSRSFSLWDAPTGSEIPLAAGLSGIAPGPMGVRDHDFRPLETSTALEATTAKAAPAQPSDIESSHPTALPAIETMTRPSDAAVTHWIALAMGTSRGESYLMARRIAWAKHSAAPNINLVAAERFMGGYEGTLNEASLGMQFLGKHFRESSLAKSVRENAPPGAWSNGHFVMLFGKNGTPAHTVDFSTRWALSGIGHRYMKIKPGAGLSPLRFGPSSRAE